jgi:hypothetical protein
VILKLGVKMKIVPGLTLPIPLAWILAIITAILPFLIVFNPGKYWSIDRTTGLVGLITMMVVMILFLADALASKIKYKPVWIVFILLCPTIAQILYLSLRTKIMTTVNQ